MDGQARVEEPIRFEILGPLRAWHGADELDLGPTKQRAVLAVLLLNANRSTSIAQIIDAVWGDEPPENGSNVVQKYVGGLRRVMEPERSPRAPGQLINRTDTGYQVLVTPVHLDAEIFHSLVRDAQSARDGGDPATARDLLSRACGLWRGEPLAGLTGPAFDAARTRLEESHAAALEAWAELEVTSGELGPAVPTLFRLVSEYPLRERLRYLLIMALYRSGRQAEALAAYRDARQFLAEEFGVEPGEGLQELHRRMLRADPTLAAPAPAPPPQVHHEPAAPVIWTSRDLGVRWWQVVGRVLVTAFPVVTLGFGTGLVVGGYAIARRSLLQASATAGYLTLVFVGAMSSDYQDGPHKAITTVAILVCMFGGALHAGTLAWRPRGWPAPERRARREVAREIFRYSPQIARQLNIGRPDLPPALDDGGLLDINTAPEWLLRMLPGIGPNEAARIAHIRGVQGTLSSLDDLTAARLTTRTRRLLGDILIFAPVPAAAPEAADIRPHLHTAHRD